MPSLRREAAASEAHSIKVDLLPLNKIPRSCLDMECLFGHKEAKEAGSRPLRANAVRQAIGEFTMANPNVRRFTGSFLSILLNCFVTAVGFLAQSNRS